MGRTRITLPKPKVRKGEKAKVTKVHEVGHIRPEPTIEEGLEEWFSTSEGRFSSCDGNNLSMPEDRNEEE